MGARRYRGGPLAARAAAAAEAAQKALQRRRAAGAGGWPVEVVPASDGSGANGAEGCRGRAGANSSRDAHANLLPVLPTAGCSGANTGRAAAVRREATARKAVLGRGPSRGHGRNLGTGRRQAPLRAPSRLCLWGPVQAEDVRPGSQCGEQSRSCCGRRRTPGHCANREGGLRRRGFGGLRWRFRIAHRCHARARFRPGSAASRLSRVHERGRAHSIV